MRLAMQKVGLALAATIGMLLLTGCPTESSLTETPNNAPEAAAGGLPPGVGSSSGAPANPAPSGGNEPGGGGAPAPPTAPEAVPDPQGGANGPAANGPSGS